MYSLILHGKRCIDSHNVCSFRVVSLKLLQNVSAFSNSFSSASDADVNFQNDLDVESVENPVKKLFTSYGFTDSQISGIITSYPRVLALDAEKSLLPKLQALESKGASSSELIEIVSIAPKILGERGAKSTGLCYDFIKDIIGKDKQEGDNKSKLCESSSASQQGNKFRNLSVLRELGVPQQLLFKLLLSKNQPVSRKENFEESVNKIVEMGFDPTSLKFVQALQVVYDLSEQTIEGKVNACKSLGFVVEDVWEIFKKWPEFLKYSEKNITQTFQSLKNCGLVEDEVIIVMKKHPKCICASEEKINNCVETFLGLGFSREEFLVICKCYPQCLMLSTEAMKMKIDYLVKKMEWSLKEVIVVPPVLGYSLEKRIKPRCNVIKALMAKGLIKGTPPMSSVVVCTDEIFLKRYVLKHEKLVPELMALFKTNGDHISLS